MPDTALPKAPVAKSNGKSDQASYRLEQRQILAALRAFRKGDFSVRLPLDFVGVDAEIAETFNDVVEFNNHMTKEFERLSAVVGKEGKIGHRAKLAGATGGWEKCIDSINTLVGDMLQPTTEVARVIGAVAKGDLGQSMLLEIEGRPLRGEFLRIGKVVNTMVAQLGSFASEVTRVAREVGTEGKLGGQAKVEGVAGTWKDLTDNVNMMAANLTGQVRGIAEVVTAVAQGDLKRKLTVDAKGEIAALADTINGMIETLAIFADQVTNVAREVGIEGKLGGQAKVPGAAGLWRDLTDNVNQLAANLTTQVRAIAEVATAVTKGDLTRSIAVEASGEVAALKDNINEMIRNLKETTLKNTEQDWLKTNLAKFTRMLQGERDLVTVSNLILSELAPLVGAQHGVFYITSTDPEDEEDKGTFLDMVASYAFKERKNLSSRYRLREGLIGQCAFEKESIMLTHVPADYIQINSGLGEAPPLSIIVLPVLFEGECKAVIELASFSRFSETHRSFLDQLMESIGIVLNTIAANMRTEGLLKQSQLLTTELQSQQEELKKTNDRLEMQANSLRQSEEMLKAQQEELRRTNEELEEKASLLSQEKKQVEEKNREVEIAKAALEEKAEQLALTSKYKSEFLANMSHELRTPLNSLLILSKLLADNPQGNLNPKQTEFARTINSAGSDLLALINDILDLSKIESGTVTIEIDDVEFGHVSEHMERTFRQVAQDRKLGFKVEVDRHLPNVMRTDGKRLQQVINNLLANAFKFTETGEVRFKVEAVTGGWSSSHPVLNSAKQVVAFSVIDTGIGVPEDKQKIIFEAFQQADGTTSRKYGGTGLGLSISREIAQRLGGEIRIESQPGKGSTFTLYLPLNYEPAAQAAAKVQHASPSAPMVSASVLPMPREPISSELADDRDRIGGEDPVLLIVEDDPEGAALMMAVAREQGFKALVSPMGTATMGLAKRYRPKAITIDLDLSDIEGWSLFDELKHDPETRHIPLHLFGADAKARRGLEMGAVGYTAKPLGREAMSEAAARLKAFSEREGRRLLLVDADPEQRAKQAELLATASVDVVQASSAKDALKALAVENFDCLVLSLGLPRGSAYQVLERLATLETPPPVVAYSNRDIGEAEESKLKSYADSFTVKQALSSEEILDLTCLYLHQDIAALGEERRQFLIRRQQRDPQLHGRSVLIIDDDIRNIFTLTSVLEQHGINVVFAENGRDGIQKLRDTHSVDVALVDVMMPEMDGYEVMREIRRDPAWGKLPVVAVTAKAMQGDRKKCIEAGASDYLAKPVDVSQLLATLRAWVVQ